MKLDKFRILFTVLFITLAFTCFWNVALFAEENENADEENLTGLPVLPPIDETNQPAESPEEDLTVIAMEFQGNLRISDEQILAVMVTRPGRPFSFSDLDEDMVRISEMGYFQAPPKYNAEPMAGGVKLIVFLKENPLYSGLKITIVGPGIKTEDEIKELFHYSTDEIISAVKLVENYERIEAAYRDMGYTAATISSVDYDDNGVVSLEINEGIIQEIKVEGNNKTRDFVILREINLKPGDIYDAISFRRDLENIFALQLFEDISVDYQLTDDKKIIVIVKVTEARTGQFGVGGGYSSQDGLLATFSYSEKNFRGMGQRVNLQGQFGGPNPDFLLSFYSPVIDKKRTSMTVELFMMSNTDRIRNAEDPEKFTKFTTEKKGGSLGFTRPMSKTVKLTAKLSMLDGKIDVDDAGGELPPEQIEDQLADYAERGLIDGQSNSILLGVTKDTRDFVLDPSTGYMLGLTGTYYGLGGDFDAIKGTAEYRTYFNLNPSKDKFVTGIDPSRFHANSVIAFRIMVGVSDGGLSLMDSFRIGGSETVRGVEDSLQTGDQMLLSNLEFRFPIITNLSAAVFIDSGTASALGNSLSMSDLVTSIGAGIRYRIPFFGIAPLRLDYGYDIKNNSGRVTFGFGQLF
jgi:outer membrane protein insertion porin family